MNYDRMMNALINIETRLKAAEETNLQQGEAISTLTSMNTELLRQNVELRLRNLRLRKITEEGHA